MRSYGLDGISREASVIGLGTMIFHPDSTGRDMALLDAFVAGGGTYVDTAEIYGASEQHGYSEMVIGSWLEARPGMRERIVLASKGLIPGTCPSLYPGGASIGPEQIHRAIEGSLGRLKTDRLDIWMFHRDDPSLPLGPLIDALDEEIQNGRLGAWGASNWTTARLQEAIDHAARTGKAAPVASSPNFSLAHANEPYWPNTVVTSPDDRAWFARTGMPLVAWSSLGRGFFSHGREDDHSNADLVRVYYSEENFARKRRAEALAEHKGRTLFEIAIGWVINQAFPVTALCGARTLVEVGIALRAGDLQLSASESGWLDGSLAERPF